ncbi:MAG TPA: IS1595 family transposase [Acidobacteriaceae bacterium]|jgi:transposase-like protein|nr:IS1595 family transposase [Acidobacteriaceae bacterium]
MDAPKTLLEAIKYFNDEQVCINAVAEMRWPNGVVCPRCNGDQPYWFETQKRWKCRKCRKQFSVKVGSIFEDSPISLQKWLPALWMLSNCKNGVSSYEIARDLGVTQKTAWFMLQRLRLVLRSNESGKMSGHGGPIEIDETFVGGNLKFMHRDKKVRYEKRGGSHGKAVVMGMLERETRQVRAKVIPDVKRETLQSEIFNQIQRKATIYSDGYAGYDGLKVRNFIHETVNHAEEYVRGQVHTQGIENFWSLLKRGLKGTYVAVEPFHLDRYIDEQVFRYNNRGTKDNPLNDADRFLIALSQVAGKRLTYAEVTGKLERTEA